MTKKFRTRINSESSKTDKTYSKIALPSREVLAFYLAYLHFDVFYVAKLKKE